MKNAMTCQLLTVFLLGQSVILFAQESLDDRADDPMHIKEFGIVQGQPISNGFLIVNGQYIEMPYIVSRKGLWVLVNDQVIESSPIPWPPQNKPSEDIDPVMPSGIDKETSLYDKVLTTYIQAKYAYHNKHYPEKESQLNEALFRELPCVKDVQYDEHNSSILHVKSYRGEECPVQLRKIKGRTDLSSDLDSVLRHMENVRDHYERCLAKGDCIFTSAQGGRLVMSEANARDLLPQLIKLTRSVDLVEQRRRNLSAAGFASERMVYYENFSASPQLEQRLSDGKSRQ